MQTNVSVENRCHSHVFDDGNPLAERNVRWALGFTAIMMVIEITGGWRYNSMALLAEGWHMSSHALVLGLAVLAYRAARQFAHHERFAFGTWKIEVLGGYTSAVALVGVTGLIFYESVERLVVPSPIHYGQAIVIAIAGLLINLVCAWLLKGNHDHQHGHGHTHTNDGHAHHHHDLNLRAAYVHVLADAATSVLAILALTCGMIWGVHWLDPAIGVVGSGVIAVWAYRLLRDSGRVLLDAEMNVPVVAEIREAIASSRIKAEMTDLHVWRVGKGKYACIVSLVTEENAQPDDFKRLLSIHEELVHITIEVNQA